MVYLKFRHPLILPSRTTLNVSACLSEVPSGQPTTGRTLTVILLDVHTWPVGRPNNKLHIHHTWGLLTQYRAFYKSLYYCCVDPLPEPPSLFHLYIFKRISWYLDVSMLILVPRCDQLISSPLCHSYLWTLIWILSKLKGKMGNIFGYWN